MAKPVKIIIKGTAVRDFWTLFINPNALDDCVVPNLAANFLRYLKNCYTFTQERIIQNAREAHCCLKPEMKSLLK